MSRLELQHVYLSFGGVKAVQDFSLKAEKGQIIGIIGPNGAGKTTLFRMIAGEEKPDAGTLKVGESVKLAYVDQHRESLEPGKTVYELVSQGRDTIQLGAMEVNARAYCNRFNFSGQDQQKKEKLANEALKRLSKLKDGDAEALRAVAEKSGYKCARRFCETGRIETYINFI